MAAQIATTAAEYRALISLDAVRTYMEEVIGEEIYIAACAEWDESEEA